MQNYLLLKNLDGSFGDCVVNETNIKVLLSCCFFSNIIFVCIEQVPIQSFECYPSLVLALSSSAVLNDLFLIFFFLSLRLAVQS